ncbi:MAG: cupin domain-containing protein [Rothia sp. (in: high G+C Gram-positive bacteria)]|nr:cupin domain-containing protein [Rothia sp. (in: high G+C Gram-positive bacteria)]
MTDPLFPLGSPAPEGSFTGKAYMHPLAPSKEMQSLAVTFEAEARTNWHTHDLGQLIVVTSGTCIYQLEGQEPALLHPGDSFFFEAGINHWHGATADGPMTHIAITPFNERGEFVTWGEPVDEATYRG